MRRVIYSLICILFSSYICASQLSNEVQLALPASPVKSAVKTNINLKDLIKIKFSNNKTAFISSDHKYLILGAVINLQNAKIIN